MIFTYFTYFVCAHNIYYNNMGLKEGYTKRYKKNWLIFSMVLKNITLEKKRKI